MSPSFLRDLGSLKKIPTLRDVSESPVESRFSSELIKQCGSFVNAMARTYAIPDRISADDLRQELWVHVWKLAKRVDPVSRADDFTRQFRTELRNKCIDINRYYKARKRTGRTGRAVQCLCCGSVSRICGDEESVCKFCGEVNSVREVETYSRNLSIGDTEEQQPDSLVDRGSVQPVDEMIEDELAVRVRKSLDEFGKVVYDLLTNPSDTFLQHLERAGHSGDHRTAANRHFSSFLKTTDKAIQDAKSNIASAVSHICSDL